MRYPTSLVTSTEKTKNLGLEIRGLLCYNSGEKQVITETIRLAAFIVYHGATCLSIINWGGGERNFCKTIILRPVCFLYLAVWNGLSYRA